jgi:hypothetical protein
MIKKTSGSNSGSGPTDQNLTAPMDDPAAPLPSIKGALKSLVDNGDDEAAGNARQISGQIFGDAVSEVILVGIIREVGKG